MATKRTAKPKPAAAEDPALVGQLDTRRCKGSVTFGIPAHDALVADFPVQPSRPDGLGTMCRTHWREYTNALRKAALERKGGQGGPDAETPAIAAPEAPEPVQEAAAPRRRRAKPEPTIDPALAAAERLLQDVDALPGPEHVKAIATDEVQAAFATVARGRGHAEPEEVAAIA